MKVFKNINVLVLFLLIIGIGWSAAIKADNQTPTISLIYSDHHLPFRVKLKVADFALPTGLQSYINF